MSANEKAEAILIVIKRILRWCAYGILGLIAAGLVIAACIWVYQWLTVDRHKANIKVVALFGEKVCDDKKFPMLVGIVNNSSKTLEKISVDVKVTRIGYSSKLNGWDSFAYDKIIKPGESWAQCWSVRGTDYARSNLDGTDLEAAVESFTPTFMDKK